MLNVHDVAEYFLRLSGTGLDHMKLQKLCYLAQAYHLGMYQERLFDDQFRAFKWGPVSDTLWRQHRYTQGLIRPSGHESEMDADEKALLESVFARYGCYSGWELSRITHRDEAYKNAWASANDAESDTLDEATISRHYAARLTVLDTAESPPLPEPEMLQSLARDNDLLREQSWTGFKESEARGFPA